MNPTQDKYPHFEANQVLTNSQLNQIFDYLDEQERLTRANLIGIGIECGLEINTEINGKDITIHLEKGCGVTSAGYLIVEPVNVNHVAYQDYVLPLEVDYPPFKYTDNGILKQYQLWELFPDGQKNTKPLGTVSNFLADKAVILFLELKKEGLRNCSSNNCDDKGEEVSAAVKPLLIKLSDLSKIIAKANQLGSEFTFTDVEAALSSRLHLPDIRVPRHFVPIANTVTSNQVLAAFLQVFQNEKLAFNTGNALSAAYQAFRPLLLETYPDDPFKIFAKKFGALDKIPANTSQVRFLQYYCDFFDDIIQAYDEFRWKGVSFMCACCPPEALFPRHLMLGAAQPATAQSSGIYRHHFMPSAAISDCEDKSKEVLQLFIRLVEMVNHFTDNPTPPDFSNKEIARKLMPLRITPSKLSDAPISEKAIPYYYLQSGTTPLYRYWSIEKTQRNRANQNMSFRSDEYLPKAPSFITNPLQYNLEPFNFLRIEGHLGKNFKNVMSTLLGMKMKYHLPVEFIALRTGEFDARMTVDLSKEECRFEDLEALYDALRDELVCSLGKTLASFYNKKVDKTVPISEGFNPRLIRSLRNNFIVQPSTFGAMLETYYAGKSQVEPPRTFASKAARFARLKDIFMNESAVIRATASFAEVLLDISNFLNDKLLSDFDLAEFQDLYDQLEQLNENIKTQPGANGNEWTELFNQLEAVHYANQLESFKSIAEEYRRRLIEVKKKQFLGYFIQQNPGIQHKAGVPLGGTFIVVYHDDPTPIRKRVTMQTNLSAARTNFANAGFSAETTDVISEAFSRIQSKADQLSDPDIQLLISEFSRQLPSGDITISKGDRFKTSEKIINETVNEFADGTVIADFYLPYICCSDCSPIQYVLPEDPLTFTSKAGCTNSDNNAEVKVTPLGGTAPYKIKINNDDLADLTESFTLTAGTYSLTLIDADGTVSAAQQLVIPEQILTGEFAYDCNPDTSEYVVNFQVSGGVAPYTANRGNFDGDIYFSDPLPSETDIEIIITDSRNCSTTVIANHFCEPPCKHPCEGQMRKCAYRLWLQPPATGSLYREYQQLKEVHLRFNGQNIGIPNSAGLLQIAVDDLNKDFDNAVSKVVLTLNKVIQKMLTEKFGAEGEGRLLVSYEPDKNDPFGILWIEHFVCETFTLEFEFVVTKPSQKFNLKFRYTNEPDESGKPIDGTVTTNVEMGRNTFVPAFDCRERNLCSGSDYVKLCTLNALKPEFVIKPMENSVFSFESTTQNTNVVAWVWDVLNTAANEPFYQGEQVLAMVQKPTGKVRMTVIDENGCFKFVDEIFKI